jgi:hypothetical protein
LGRKSIVVRSWFPSRAFAALVSLTALFGFDPIYGRRIRFSDFGAFKKFSMVLTAPFLFK